MGDDKIDTFLRFDTPLASGAGFHAEVCEDFWDVLVGDTNNGHGEGSIAGDIENSRAASGTRDLWVSTRVMTRAEI